MAEVKPSLKALMAKARERGPMSSREIAAQRRSFVLAEAGFGSDADEAEYRDALRRGDEDAIRHCHEKSERRIAAVTAILDEQSG